MQTTVQWCCHDCDAAMESATVPALPICPNCWRERRVAELSRRHASLRVELDAVETDLRRIHADRSYAAAFERVEDVNPASIGEGNHIKAPSPFEGCSYDIVGVTTIDRTSDGSFTIGHTLGTWTVAPTAQITRYTRVPIRTASPGRSASETAAPEVDGG